MTVFMREQDVFSYAFSQYADMVYRIALSNTVCAADAEDVTQEAFLRLLESGKTFHDAEHLKAWLIRVTINLCRDDYRRKNRLAPLTREIANRPVYDGNRVLEAVSALPENYRNVIYLHYYEGYTAKEIGKILGAKENTVLSWLFRARAALENETIGGLNNG